MPQKKKGTKPKKSARGIFRLVGTFLLIAGIIVTFIGAGVVSSCLIEAINFNPDNYQIARTSTLYYLDSTGDPHIYESVNSPSNLRWIKSSDIPNNMKNAAIAIEDERFLKHHGVDLKRTLAAVIVNITGQDSFGGSTITQQVVKNITRDDERDALRKVREIFRAIKLESEYSKDEIMEFYLNVAYFGYGNGVQAASHAYFGKDVSDLNLAECAAIVGITKYPSKYNPITNPENNKQRQELVLKKMFELDMISQEEYEEAINYKLDIKSTPSSEIVDPKQSYFTEYVIEQVTNDLVEKGGYTEAVAKSMIYNGGLTIYTTVDPFVQKSMEDVLENRSLYTTAGSVQAAMVIMNPMNGQVKGVVGGAGQKPGDLVLNRAVDTYRQPGSTMKPLAVYGPALERGIYSGTGDVVEDKAININGYKPQNWYAGYKGRVPLQEAIIQSMNTPAVQTVHKMGVNVSLSYLKNKYHISSIHENDENLAVSLGGLTTGVSVLEWTAAYCTFPNHGEWISPICYTKVVDHSGKVILESQQITEKVFNEQTNFLITEILRDTATRMAGAISGMSCGGKTGTTNNYVDKWYMGFTPYYTGGVWVGNDNSKPMSDGATINAPQRIWTQVMRKIHADLDDIGFDTMPSGIRRASVCAYTGKLASEECETVNSYVNSNLVKYCDGNHPLPEPEETEEETENEGEGEEENSEQTPPSNEETSPTPPDTNTPVEGAVVTH